MTDLITMDGQWAYAYDPYTPARILCVDRPGGDCPVVSMCSDGRIWSHYADGSIYLEVDDRHDLVPLQVRRKPVEAWALVGTDGEVRAFSLSLAYITARAVDFPGARLVRLIEAEDAP